MIRPYIDRLARWWLGPEPEPEPEPPVEEIDYTRTCGKCRKRVATYRRFANNLILCISCAALEKK